MKRETYKHKSTAGIRIIGGSLKRSKIEVLNRMGLRPTPNRVRETLFNWLVPSIPGASILDCFAGSGALGFEALSRGALSCTFVEQDPQVAKHIQSNVERFQLHAQANVIANDVFDVPSEIFIHADIIFADPPFHHGLSQKFLTWIKDKVHQDSRLVIECGQSETLNLKGFEIIKELKAGIDWLHLLRPIS
ncbi:MAG TPA: 16S rRNA (guanine(966)-N(2))-methyltransferase RsmD [Gammaproteobacteria bacterium]|nr:16S rRNA (guanine(966)-N(2))-methyltransferase RsmD [Gammaproteobacteria bacterium]